MEIKKLWNGEVECSYNIHLNDKIVRLLKCRPEWNEGWTLGEIYKLNINDVINMHSWILNRNKTYDNITFAEAIKKHYDIDCLQYKYFYEFLMAMK